MRCEGLSPTTVKAVESRPEDTGKDKGTGRAREKERRDQRRRTRTSRQVTTLLERPQPRAVEALNAKNYDLAISKFDEGVAAVPDFVGSTPIMLDGKLVALRARGYDKYREGATQDRHYCP